MGVCWNAWRGTQSSLGAGNDGFYRRPPDGGSPSMRRAQTIAFASGATAAILVLAGVWFGSGNFSRFDTPLAAYAAATIFAAFASVYRYAMWVQRPPTWHYFK